MKNFFFLTCMPLVLAAFILLLEFTHTPPSTQVVHVSHEASLPFVTQSATSPLQGLPTGISASTLVSRDLAHLYTQREEAWCPPEGPVIAIVATTSESLDQITHWMRYYQKLGVSYFYLFVEGRAARADVVRELRTRSGVVVFEQDDSLRWWQQHSRYLNEAWLAYFFNKPCNYQLFLKQTLNMEVAVHQAMLQGVHWIAHFDTDELMRPTGTPHFSLQEVLDAVPAEIDMVILPNYESLPERADVTEPFLEVSLFKRSYTHVDQAQFAKHYRDVAHGNKNYYVTYSNGKAMARMQPGLRSNGAHRWASYNKKGDAWKEYTHPDAALLHYTYNRFFDVMNRRDRCDCAPTEEDVKRCFFLDFDREVFVTSSVQPRDQVEKFFHERLVWANATLVRELLKVGLLERISEPQLLMTAIKEQPGNGVIRRPPEHLLEDERRREYAELPAVAPGTRWNSSCARFRALDSSVSFLDLAQLAGRSADNKTSDALLEETSVFALMNSMTAADTEPAAVPNATDAASATSPLRDNATDAAPGNSTSSR